MTYSQNSTNVKGIGSIWFHIIAENTYRRYIQVAANLKSKLKMIYNQGIF
jgi:hypothetical protein